MNNSVLFTCFLIFVQFNILSQIKIELVVISTLPKEEKVFIAGNKSELGNWNPGKISLNKINDSTWTKVFEFKIGEIIEFKFTQSNWDEEALNKSGKISGNTIIKVSTDTTLIYKIDHWGNNRSNIKGQITGNVRYHKNFAGRSILPRDIIVWLPPGYDSLPDRFYPVLYMNDGQNIFDPATSLLGIDWQIDEVADSLIKAKSIKELIIVGIYNTVMRGIEYNHTQLGSKYMNFLIEELKPFIDKTYRTLPDCKNTAIGGSSSGGLISMIIQWEHSDVFSKAACFSPAFKIDGIDYVTPVKNYTGARKNIKLFIYNGGIGLEEQLQPGIDEMLSTLYEKGYVEKRDFLYVKDYSSEHNESAWAKNIYKALEYIFPLKE